MDGTLDEIGNGPRNAETLLDGAFGAYPSEAEYRAQEAEKAARARTEFVR
ncbi:hypothetical protein [Streptomyces sp. MK37H]|nr:hypothetical protein [Streptomyces sp. MK37H]